MSYVKQSQTCVGHCLESRSSSRTRLLEDSRQHELQVSPFKKRYGVIDRLPVLLHDLHALARIAGCLEQNFFKSIRANL